MRTARRVPLMDAQEERRRAREMHALRRELCTKIVGYAPARRVLAQALEDREQPDELVARLARSPARQHETGEVAALIAADPACKAAYDVVESLEANSERASRPSCHSSWLERVQAIRSSLERARARFVRANLRLVVKVAHRFRQPTRLPLDDLVQEGNLGLLHAVDLYDPGRETRFSTYAVWWIFHRMTRALTDCGRLVRIPSHIQAAFYRVRKKRAELREETGHEASAVEAAAEAGVSPAKLAEAERLMSATVVDVDASPAADRPPEGGVQADDHVLDPATVVDVHCGVERLEVELERLPPRQRDVLARRFGLRDGEPATLREIADDYGISGERVRQIQRAGLRRLRARIQEAPIAA